MKNTIYSKKDRIVCVSEAITSKVQVKGKNRYKDSSYTKSVALGQHSFYYQPANSNERFYLFSTKRFSPSIAAFFAAKGVLLHDDRTMQTYSITFAEFYRLKGHGNNYILNKVFDRIPVWTNATIRYELDTPRVTMEENHKDICRSNPYRWDDERVA